MRSAAGFIFAIILVTLPVFAHLDHLPIQLWDESRLAVNALEMLDNDNWLVPTYDWAPDMWNTKPPLLIWLQSLFLNIFGFSELAIRLPSALAVLSTFAVLYWLVGNKWKLPWLALIIVLVLVTAKGYMRLHGARTGDYDALLCLLMLVYAVSFYLYTEERNKKYIYVFFIALGLGVLTKGIAALLFLPGLAFFALATGNVLPLLRAKAFYLGVLVFLILGPGYYLVREVFNPGYLDAVVANEVSGRYNTVIEGHHGDHWYYYNWITSEGLSAFYYLVPLGLIAGIFQKGRRLRKFTLFSSLLALSHIIIISCAASKLSWYDLPSYPFLAFLAGVFLFTVFEYFRTIRYQELSLTYNIFPVVFLCFIFYKPYTEVLRTIADPPPAEGEGALNERIAYFMRSALRGEKKLENHTLVWNVTDANLKWYYKSLRKQGQNVDQRPVERLTGTERVVVFGDQLSNYVQERFEADLLAQDGEASYLQLRGKRADTGG